MSVIEVWSVKRPYGSQSLPVGAHSSAFKTIGEQFGAANSATVTSNFAGSDQLAAQIGQGAPADVFASANTKQMDVFLQAGEVLSGTQRTFVRNRLVVVYPKDNPGKLTALKDLANPGVKPVLANKNVPVGGYALDLLSIKRVKAAEKRT